MRKAGGLFSLICMLGLVGYIAYMATPQSESRALIESQDASRFGSQGSSQRGRDISPNLVTATAAVAARTPNVRHALDLAAHLDQNHVGGSKAVDQEVMELAARLTSEDASQLKEIAQQIAKTDKDGHNARSLAVYLLSQNPEMFTHQLEDIAGADGEIMNRSTSPHTQAEAERRFEEALHAQALLALDRLNKIDSREKAFFSQLVQNHSNPFVRKLARMGVVGADQHRTLINDYIPTEI